MFHSLSNYTIDRLLSFVSSGNALGVLINFWLVEAIGHSACTLKCTVLNKYSNKRYSR